MTEQTKGHTKAIRQCVLMLETIEIYLSYSNSDIYAIFSGLSKKNSYSKLLFIDKIYNNLKNGVDFDDAYVKNLNNPQTTKFLDKNDIDLLKGFYSVLGQSDVDGQISNCRLYKQFFNQKLNTLESQEKSKCKSNIALSIGSGLIISIIFLKV